MISNESWRVGVNYNMEWVVLSFLCFAAAVLRGRVFSTPFPFFFQDQNSIFGSRFLSSSWSSVIFFSLTFIFVYHVISADAFACLGNPNCCVSWNGNSHVQSHVSFQFILYIEIVNGHVQFYILYWNSFSPCWLPNGKLKFDWRLKKSWSTGKGKAHWNGNEKPKQSITQL